MGRGPTPERGSQQRGAVHICQGKGKLKKKALHAAHQERAVERTCQNFFFSTASPTPPPPPAIFRGPFQLLLVFFYTEPNVLRGWKEG